MDPEKLFGCIAVDAQVVLLGWIDPGYARNDLQVAVCTTGLDWRTGCDPSTSTRLEVDPAGIVGPLELPAPDQITTAGGLRVSCVGGGCGYSIFDDSGRPLFLLPFSKSHPPD
jgi:hypothetical protein